MAIISTLSLFAAMLVLAALPSSSVALVVARSASKGTAHGMAVAAGIVAGDLLFILLALLGLNALAQSMAGVFLVIKYLGAAYLIFLGWTLIRAKPAARGKPQSKLDEHRLSSFAAGLALTLGDLKAIIFYVSFFPLFVDLENLRALDILIIVFVTVIAVGGVKAAYALLAARYLNIQRTAALNRPIRIATGTCLIGAGTSLLIKQ